ncbi:MAG: hypothetical protein SOY47_02170, partial [Lachnospiraceae bacterium]|nr:hypothetical protein [Lachnospiraceae bacterium]
DDDYIFASFTGRRRQGRRIYDIHRMILKKADIPFLGDGNGPRLHDWRYPNLNKIQTFCR